MGVGKHRSEVTAAQPANHRTAPPKPESLATHTATRRVNGAQTGAHHTQVRDTANGHERPGKGANQTEHRTKLKPVDVFKKLVYGVVRSILLANRLLNSTTLFDYTINATLILNVLATEGHRVTFSKILINIIFIPTVFVDKNKILIIIASQVLVLERRLIVT